MDEVEWEVAKRLALKHRVTVKTIVGLALQMFDANDRAQPVRATNFFGKELTYEPES